MTLPTDLNQLERTKFTDINGPAVRTALVSAPTVYAVVNTVAAGIQDSLTTLLNSDAKIGFVTASQGGNWSVSINSNVTVIQGTSPWNSLGTMTLGQMLPAGTNYIGLATVNVGNTVNTLLTGNVTLSSNVTLNPSPNFIGLVSTASIKGQVSITGGVNISSNVTLNPSNNWIGLATTTIGSSPTLYAVVNAGEAVLSGNVTLNPSNNWIGLATAVIGSSPTLYAVVNTGAVGTQNSMVTLLSSPNWIGLVSTASIHATAGLAAGGNYIGLATVTMGSKIPTGDNFIGLVSTASIQGKVSLVGNATLNASNAWVGLVSTASIKGQVSLVGNATVINGAGSAFIGLVSTASIQGKVSLVGNATLNASNAWIGLATVVVGASSAFIGLVSTASIQGKVETIRAKTLEIIPIGMYNSGNATLFVPVGTFYITSLVVSSSATQTLKILSGASYLVGNASVGITIFPGGGWVETGSVDTPIYKGLAANAAFVLNSSVTASVAGKIIYYVE